MSDARQIAGDRVVSGRTVPRRGESVTLPAGGEVQIAEQDASRQTITFSLSNTSPAVVYVRPAGSEGGIGLLVNSSSPVLTLTRSVYGDMVCDAWIGSTTTSQPLFVLQTYRPNGG